MGDPCPRILPLPSLKLHKSLIESILDTISALRQYWNGVFPLQGTYEKPAVGDEELEQSNLRPFHRPIVEYRGKLGLQENQPTVYQTRECYPIQLPEVKLALEKEIQSLKDLTDICNPFLDKKSTCIFYSDLMKGHKNVGANHPERPSRITQIYKKLDTSGLLDKCLIPNELRYATDDELKLVHTEDHIKSVQKLKTMSQKKIDEYAFQLDSIYMCKETEFAARLASGALLSLVDKVAKREARNGFAIIRPPGHHAAADKAAGFCIFNNIAIAAKYAIKEPDEEEAGTRIHFKKVMIVDFDVHHGDGTQSLVEGDPNILFISLHRHDATGFYPNSLASGLKTTQKNIINIPWNYSMMGDKEYIMALLLVILPVAYDFNPDLVLVSAGFDAAVKDPLGEYHVNPEAYGHFIHHLSALAEGRLIMALEGGYNLDSISSASAYCVSALLGQSLPALKELELDLDREKRKPDHAIDLNAQETLKEVVDYHSTTWPSLQFGVDLPPPIII